MQTANRKYQRSIHANPLIAFRFCLPPFAFFLFFLAFCLLPSSCLSQIIAPSPYEIYTNEPKFNKNFIRQNKIKTITTSVVDKPDGEIIRDKGLAQIFAFDTSGNLIRQYYNEITSLEKTEIEIPAIYNKGRVIKKAQTKIDYQYQYDTLGTEFFYTSNGYLKTKRVCIGNFYNTTYYEYFGDGLVSRQTLCRETNVARSGEPFKLGVQTIISDEKFEYDALTPTQIKKRFLNDEGKAYKQGILNFQNGKPVEEAYEFIVGFVRSGIAYKYDSQDRLMEKVMTDNSSGSNVEKITYDYDANGDVIAEKQYKNGEQTNEIIYIYDILLPPGGEGRVVRILTSQADRQIQKASIKIIKYEYSFY